MQCCRALRGIQEIEFGRRAPNVMCAWHLLCAKHISDDDSPKAARTRWGVCCCNQGNVGINNHHVFFLTPRWKNIWRNRRSFASSYQDKSPLCHEVPMSRSSGQFLRHPASCRMPWESQQRRHVALPPKFLIWWAALVLLMASITVLYVLAELVADATSQNLWQEYARVPNNNSRIPSGCTSGACRYALKRTARAKAAEGPCNKARGPRRIRP